MIVFTIYENGGNAGALGTSFSCAVFGVRCGSGGNNGAPGIVLGIALGNAGALSSMGAAGVRFRRVIV